jgi:ATP-binding protein involved in chromosome partitioning
MRIAMPVFEGALATHFGHASQFMLFDTADGRVTASRTVTPPEHAPGVLPAWLKENGVEVVLAGGMGARAQALFGQAGIQLVCGIAPAAPEAVVGDYLAGRVQTGANPCDH